MAVDIKKLFNDDLPAALAKNADTERPELAHARAYVGR